MDKPHREKKKKGGHNSTGAQKRQEEILSPIKEKLYRQKYKEPIRHGSKEKTGKKRKNNTRPPQQRKDNWKGSHQ